MKNKEKKKNRFLWLVGSLSLTAIGVLIIPPLINKVSTKGYKESLQNQDINQEIEELEPEIVLKEEDKAEEKGES